MTTVQVRIVQPLLPQPVYPPVQTVRVQAAPLPDLFNAMPRDSVNLPVRQYAPVPAAPVHFQQPVYQQYSQPGLPHYEIPSQLIKDSKPKSYREKLGESLQRVGNAEVEKLEGAGKVIVGAAKTTVYAPLGALEAVGRTAVAMTGGQVSYPDGSPLDQVGDGLTRIGEGTGQVIVASGKQAVAVTESLVYAPLATLEAGAHGAGMVVGGAVKAGTWVGKQVSESFIGREFGAGYREMMPSKN